MSENKLNASIRTVMGKGAARKTRKAGFLPAIIYSKGQESLSVSVSPKELTHILRRPLRRNTLIELDVAGEGLRHVMVRDLQKHPFRREIIHVDFVQVDPTKEVVVQVPLQVKGRSKAVAEGGHLEQVRRLISVACLPAQIPATIDIDITNQSFGSMRIADIRLPEGLTLKDDLALSVVTIRVARGNKIEEEEAAAAAAAAAAAPAAEAATATPEATA